mmetsp:Transcript_22257/g.33333  ORF Transcript_22257/g.33333 Transcript_22257/m.33333 type:complete len:132 (-) Transcript_22257:197-592(-)
MQHSMYLTISERQGWSTTFSKKIAVIGDYFRFVCRHVPTDRCQRESRLPSPQALRSASPLSNSGATISGAVEWGASRQCHTYKSKKTLSCQLADASERMTSQAAGHIWDLLLIRPAALQQVLKNRTNYSWL